MGKIRNILLISAVMQIGIILFISGSYKTTTLTDMLLNPSQWGSNGFFDYLGLTLAALGTTTVIAGLILFRTEFPIYAGFAGIFMGFSVSIFNFWQAMKSQGVWGDSSGIILALFMVPLIILFITLVVDYARGRDS